MPRLKALIILFLALALGACERQAELDSPQVYTKRGLAFSLPGNWSVEAGFDLVVSTLELR